MYREIKKLITGSENLDNLLGGGLESQSITQIYGKYHDEQSILMHQIAVNCTMTLENGGMNSDAIFISTKEESFNRDTINNICSRMGISPDYANGRIHVVRVEDEAQQIRSTEEILQKFRGYRIGAVIINDFSIHFKDRYAGRGSLSERQQNLNRHLHDLLKIATILNAVIVLNNEITSDGKKAYAGSIVGHTATFSIRINKGKAGKFMATLTDSSYLPEGSAQLKITTNGLID